MLVVLASFAPVVVAQVVVVRASVVADMVVAPVVARKGLARVSESPVAPGSAVKVSVPRDA